MTFLNLELFSFDKLDTVIFIQLDVSNSYLKSFNFSICLHMVLVAFKIALELTNTA